ncbi:MAG: sigma-70 family RNA polymerase sigma factor [Acidobacteria bacterium]|nr:sigma-70 family RNA polymerase sigma factor [Acidobacteriota bacterium]
MSREILVRAEEQIARSAAGDQVAFATLVREHQGMVFSLAYHLLRDRSLAEELAQEVFLLLHQNLSSIKSPAHLKFWLRKVTSHRSIDQMRRQQARPQVPLDEVAEPVSVERATDPLLSKSLHKLIAALPEKARLVLILRYQEDLEPMEIAEVLEMPLNTVKSHLRRSLATLREKLTRCIGEVNV